MQNVSYASVLIWVSVVCLLLAYLSWKRRTIDGAIAFAILMVATALYAFGSSFEVSSTSMVRTIWFMRLEFVGIVTMPATWLVFAHQYTHHEWRDSRRLSVLLLIVPLLTLFVVWTNGNHHLFWPTMDLVATSEGTLVLEKTYGLVFWIHLAYTYLLLVAGGVLIIRNLLRTGSLYRGQMAVLLTGGVISLVGNFVYLLRVGALRGLDLGPVGFMGLGLALVFDLRHFRVRDLIPMGRDALMDSAGDAVLLLDVDGRVVYLNPVASALTGRSLAQAEGQPVVEVMKELLGVRRSLTSDETQHGEVVIGDGAQARGFDLVAQPLRTRRGALVGRLAVLHDMTAHRRSEDNLRVAQLQWSQFLEASPDAMWIKDASGRYVAVNKTYRMVDPAINGDILGKTDAECFSPEKAAVYMADDRVAIEEGVSEGEFTAVGVDGRLRNFLTKKVVLRAPDGSMAGTLGVSRDITESKQMDEKLRTSEFDLRQAQAVAHVGSWHWDIAHDKFFWSDEMCRIYGIAPQESIGSVQDVLAHAIHPDDRARIEEANRAIVEDHNPQPLEYRIVWPDGSVRTVWAKPGEMTLDDNGHASSLTGVVLDITERKQAEAQLRQSQKMEAIGTLAGGVAHDFNNLLTGILGNMALMRSSLPPADPLLENLSAAETAARQAADLTRRLLTFGRNAVVLPMPMNIVDALDTTLALLKQSLPATIEIVRDYDRTVWNVLLDQSQMTQILLNLAVNARDAMEGKGTLTIQTRNVTIDSTYVSEHPYARTGEFIHISVNDTGSGMSVEVMQHLFEPFYTTKPLGSGTGLGLSVVYGAVKQAGGWITAVSTEGAGATFDIYLPRCLEQSTESLTPSSLSVSIAAGTVLVVEDEPVVLAVAQAFLLKSGCTVLTAVDGASAMDILQDRYDSVGLVFLDMTMPGMTTDEIVRGIRALDPTLPILLNSGYTSGDSVARMLQDSIVQGFLSKPYGLSELTDAVKALIRPT